MVKMRKQGHYCRICGEYKANEKFSGKGHAQHICKSCMSSMKKSAVIRNDESGQFVDDYIDEYDDTVMGGDMYEPFYDPNNTYIDSIPQSEQEHKKYGKLNKEEKIALKELWMDIVTQHWRGEHQIPFGEQYSRLKKELLVILEEQGGITMKDDKELKTVLHDSMIITINKILKMSKN